MAASDLPKPQVGKNQNPKRGTLNTQHTTSQRWPAIYIQIVLFICCLLIQVQNLECSETLNCSRPDTESLLIALNDVFNMSTTRPVLRQTTPTNISVSFILYGILGVDEKAQLLTTFLWQQLEWQIEYLKWDPVHCGATRISLPRKKLWIPDILINEFMDEERSPSVPYVYVDYSGRVIDSRPVRVVSSCNLDIYDFPFDVQNCTLTFNSYLHISADIQLSLGLSAEDTLKLSKEVMETKGEWELINITATDTYLDASEKTYDEVVYHLVLRRRATLYVVNLLVPSCFLLTVDLFSFLLPPQNVDRSAFKMTLILGYTVFLLIMNDLLPVTGNRIPLINVFFSICLALMVASLLETVLITNILSNSSHYPPVPHWIRVFVLQFLSRLVCLSKKSSSQDTVTLNPAVQEERLQDAGCPANITPRRSELCLQDQALEEIRKIRQDLLSIRLQVDQHFRANATAEDWIQIGNIIDWLLFGLYLLFISVSFIVIIGIWAAWYNL